MESSVAALDFIVRQASDASHASFELEFLRECAEQCLSHTRSDPVPSSIRKMEFRERAHSAGRDEGRPRLDRERSTAERCSNNDSKMCAAKGLRFKVASMHSFSFRFGCYLYICSPSVCARSCIRLPQPEAATGRRRRKRRPHKALKAGENKMKSFHI